MLDVQSNLLARPQALPGNEDYRTLSMSGETDLQKLLANMNPQLHEGEFVFCSVSPESFDRLSIRPIGWFRESEGITLIVERSIADDAGLEYEFVSRMITLNVHSSLKAVGFLAAVTAKLAEAKVSVNAISACYHDHLFVPTDMADRVMKLLSEMTSDSA